jgi:hypothetical protein
MTNHTSYKQLFAQLPEQKIGSEIESRVMVRIERSRVFHARIYFGLHVVSIFVAVAVCVPVAQSFMTTASTSGLDSYLSLLTSDGSYVISSWKDLSLSIVETFPIIQTTFILGLVLVIGNSLRRGTRYLPSLTIHGEHAISA